MANPSISVPSKRHLPGRKIPGAYDDPDAAGLAAAYAFGLVRNHGFLDGNKRIAWIVARLFFGDNGTRTEFTPFQAITTLQSAGTPTETGTAARFSQLIVSPP